MLLVTRLTYYVTCTVQNYKKNCKSSKGFVHVPKVVEQNIYLLHVQ